MINERNYEEWLLRKVENDLNASEAKALDKFLTAHPEYKEELAAFEQTVLLPETVAFKNKATLYREVEEVKVIPLWYQRPAYWAAAASIALVVGLSVWVMNNNGSNQVNHNVATENKQPSVSQPVVDSTVLPKNVAKPESRQGVESYASSNNNSNSATKPLHESAKKNLEPKSQSQENNFELAVTNRGDVALQSLETYPMIQFQLNQSQPIAEPRNVSFADVKRNESTAARLVTDALKLSGKENLAKAFERYSKLSDKKVEVSFNSPRLNLHKTLFLNN